MVRSKRPGVAQVLSRRQLNRALLARQMLLEHESMTAVQAIEWLVGIQAQLPGDPYVGLWSRLSGFDVQELSQLIQERVAVRIPLMRATIHLVTARDCLAMRPLLGPMLERSFYSGSPFGRRIEGMNVVALVAAGRALVEEKPLTNSELGVRLKEQWSEGDAQSMAYAIQYLVGLVQVTPRGLWGRSAKAALTTVEHWLGTTSGRPLPIEDLVRRYLAAFGPASPQDMGNWSRITGLSEVFETMRSELRTFRDESGRELFDVQNGSLPDADTPAPPRFLPVYDNALLGHADRGRIVTPHAAAAYAAVAGRSVGSVLVEGFVAGRWWLEREKDTATLVVRLASKPPADTRAAFESEATALLALLASESGVRDVAVSVVA